MVAMTGIGSWISSAERFRRLLRQTRVLASANLKARYRKTWAGFIWVVLSPLIMYAAQAIIFMKVLKIETPNYALFLLSGLLPWIFVTQTLDMSASLLLIHGRIYKSFSVDPLVFISSQVVDNSLNFFAAFTLLLVPAFVTSAVSLWGMLLAIPALVLMVLNVFFLSLLFSTLNVFYRDTKFVISFGTSVLYFLTPVFYPIEFIPQKYRILMHFNPFHHLIAPFRSSIYSFQPEVFGSDLIRAAVLTLITGTLALAFWYRRKGDVYFNV